MSDTTTTPTGSRAVAAGDYPQGTVEAYRRYWATLTGKPESEIYVPEALR